VGEYRIFGTESGRSSNDLGIHAAIAAPRASGKKGIVFSTVAALLLSCATLANAQVPAVVISSAQTLYPSVGGNTHHVAVNSLGDVFYEDDGSSTIFELMPGNSTPIPLVVGVHGGRGVAGRFE